MFRSIEAILERWRAGDRREPLVVEGVHGCGKTHTLERFAERFFPDHVRLDLRENAAVQAVSVGQPVRIVSEIGRLTGTEVTGSTLIFLDNLERAPAVMDNVRRLAASGLCAGGACACARVGPVPGSVPMHPMSFDEFLVACGEEGLAESLSDPFSETVASSHGRLLSLMREYWAVGGLPGAVSAWLSTGDSRMVDQEISRVLDSIREDAMLSVPGIAGTLWSVMTSVPEQLSGRNRKFMFSRAVPGARSKTLFESIRWLESCGAVHRLRIAEDVDPADDGDSIPPSFKLYAFDTGALRVLAGIPPEMLLPEQRAAAVPADGLAEDFALTEMVRSEYNRLSNDMVEMQHKYGQHETHLIAVDITIIQLKIIARMLDKILRSPIARFFNFFGKWYHYDKKKDEIYWESSDIIDGIFNLTQYTKEPF